MISLYCKNHHKQENDKVLCDECQEIFDYALKKVEICPQIKNKPTCQKCTVHCYGKKEREIIRKIMRYSGPRMMFKHPILTVFHFIDGFRSKKMKIKK